MINQYKSMAKMIITLFALLLYLCASAQQKATGDSVTFEQREEITYAQALQERIIDSKLSLKYAVDNIAKEINSPIFKNIPQSADIQKLQKYIQALSYALKQDLPIAVNHQ